MRNSGLKTFLLFFAVMIVFSFNLPSYAENSCQLQLELIEKQIWGFSYDNENDIERIERIEKQIFGTTSPKNTPDKRIEKINKSLGLETYKEVTSPLSELYVPEKAGEGVEYPQIDRLESLLLGSVHKEENIYSRLERLEKKVFGTKQEGDLSQRTDALKNHVSVNNDANNHGYKDPAPYFGSSYSNQSYTEAYGASDVQLQLAALENLMFKTSYSNEPIPNRLTRLENKIFKRDFAEDDDGIRLSRIQAAATAGKTAKYYDNNKIQKFASTGIQAASILLMILALIL